MLSSARQALTSPSVALENGAYRMRAPRRRSSVLHPGTRKSKPAVGVGPTAYTILLVILLATASLTSFGTAYYLFTTRWDNQASPYVSSSRADQGIQVANRHEWDPSPHQEIGHHEKFLSYLPHSGFHNQRIAFENALVLARLLNRTLLVPPIRLGSKPIHYAPSNRLRHILAAGKDSLRYCVQSTTEMPASPECSEFFDWTTISWDWLVDLSQIRSQQRLLPCSNMTDAWIQDYLHIPEEDVLTFKDADLYQYRFYDRLTNMSFPGQKYLKSVYIPSLASSPERLLQIGTLFGSSRLHLKNTTNIRVRSEIRRSMTFSHPILARAAKSIADQLGGDYLGVHIRVGDGHFRKDRRANARVVWWKLVNEVLGLDVKETLALEHRLRKTKSLRPPIVTVDFAARRVPHPPLGPLPDVIAHNLSCRGLRHIHPRLQKFNMPLFISTDARQPLQDPSIALFRRTFPCTFFLSDFPTAMAELDGLRSEDDGLALKSFLVPFLDAMLVGKAWAVVGTEGSTFSRFVQDVLWRTYRGWGIVERG